MSGTLAGYKTTVKRAGTVTTFTAEAMTTGSTVANTYTITDRTKSIWDRSSTATLTFSGNGTTIANSAIVGKADALFGNVTFSSTQAEPVTVTGRYVPTVVVAGAHTYTVNASRELLDDTDFTTTGYKSKCAGLLDVNISVSRWDGVELDFFTQLKAATAAIIEVHPGATGDVMRGWFIIESEEHDGDVGGLEADDLTYQLAYDNSSPVNAVFGWGTV